MSLDPEQHRWPYYLGRDARRKKRLEEAQAYYERAVSLAPSDVASLVWLATVDLELGALDRSEALLRAAQAQEETGSGHYWLGRVALAREAYQEAIDHLQRAQHLEPQGAGVAYALGMAYRGLGKLDRARELLADNTFGAIAPPDPHELELRKLNQGLEHRVKMALRVMAIGRYDVATRLFRQVLEAEPGHRNARTNLAVALAEQGEAAAAIEIYQGLIEEEPRSPVVRYNLALLLESPADAIEQLRRAAADAPRDADIRQELGRRLWEAGRPEQAATEFRAALEQDPGRVAAHLALAECLEQAGTPDEAAAVRRAAARLFPEDPRFQGSGP